MKPVIKWVGGKHRLLSEITPTMPSGTTRIVEPFAGGAAVTFNEQLPALLNDLNNPLISFYKQVKKDPEVLIDLILKMPFTKDYYLDVRKKEPKTLLGAAARFYYLNKTAFNGMWRENSSGKFNVPFGTYKGTTMSDRIDENLIRDAHTRLANVELTNNSFEDTFKLAKEGDWFFIDPPYVDTWDGYQANGFSHHSMIVKLLKQLDNKGIPFTLTNSYNDTTKELYKDFKQETIEVAYVVGGKNASRDKRQEILVTNR